MWKGFERREQATDSLTMMSAALPSFGAKNRSPPERVAPTFVIRFEPVECFEEFKLFLMKFLLHTFQFD